MLLSVYMPLYPSVIEQICDVCDDVVYHVSCAHAYVPFFVHAIPPLEVCAFFITHKSKHVAIFFFFFKTQYISTYIR